MATYCNGKVISVDYEIYDRPKREHVSKPNWSNINNGAKNLLFMNTKELQQHFKEADKRAKKYMAIYEEYGFD